MKKRIKLLVFCLLGLFLAATPSLAVPEGKSGIFNTDPVCPLSPPSTVTVTNITTTTADISWSAVAGAVVYEVSLYDATSAVFLPDIYTASTSITATGLEPGHEIEACVSAYSCMQGEGGDGTCESFRTLEIIIVDILVDRPDCDPFGHNVSNSVATINLPRAPVEGGTVSAAKIAVCKNVQSACNEDVTTFEMFADCFGQVQFYQTSYPYGIMRSPVSSTYCSEITFKFVPSGNTYFTVGEVTEIIDGDNISYDVKISLNNSIRNGRINYCMEDIVDGCGENAPLAEGGGKKIWLAPEKYRAATEALHTNPSPFSNGFQATYYLTKAGPATLSLLDLNGRVLHTIQQGPDTPAGQHFAAFTDLDNLPSGIYLLQLQTADGQQTVLVVKQP